MFRLLPAHCIPVSFDLWLTGDSSSKEIATALQSDLLLEDIVMNTLHSDNGPIHGIIHQAASIESLKQAVSDLKWCENVASRGLGCFYCGPDAQHNSSKCPKVMSRCFKCGMKGHSRQACKEDCVVPDQFCCRCLLPVWCLYEDRKVRRIPTNCITYSDVNGMQVHDGSCGFGCKQPLSDVAKMTFSMAAEGSILPGVVPQGTRQEQWTWLFKGRIPGILALFGALKAECTKSKRFKD